MRKPSGYWSDLRNIDNYTLSLIKSKNLTYSPSVGDLVNMEET